jgi:hypothetical protein
MSSGQTARVTLPTDEQILITREFAAPKHLVYKAGMQDAMDLLEQVAVSLR